MNKHDPLFFTLFRDMPLHVSGYFSPSSGGQVYNEAIVLLLLLTFNEAQTALFKDPFRIAL
jgi:hypothetical protein